MALPAPAGKTCALIALGLFFNTGYLCLTVFEQMVCRQHLWQQDALAVPRLGRDPRVPLLAAMCAEHGGLKDVTPALLMCNCSSVTLKILHLLICCVSVDAHVCIGTI